MMTSVECGHLAKTCLGCRPSKYRDVSSFQVFWLDVSLVHAEVSPIQRPGIVGTSPPSEASFRLAPSVHLQEIMHDMFGCVWVCQVNRFRLVIDSCLAMCVRVF